MKTTTSAGPRRQYRMDTRAATAADTERRILRSTIELYGERFHDQITLEDIAHRAGVTVQTVLRRFGTRDRLLEAAADAGAAEVVQQRRRNGDELARASVVRRAASGDRPAATTTRSRARIWPSALRVHSIDAFNPASSSNQWLLP